MLPPAAHSRSRHRPHRHNRASGACRSLANALAKAVAAAGSGSTSQDGDEHQRPDQNPHCSYRGSEKFRSDNRAKAAIVHWRPRRRLALRGPEGSPVKFGERRSASAVACRSDRGSSTPEAVMETAWPFDDQAAARGRTGLPLLPRDPIVRPTRAGERSRGSAIASFAAICERSRRRESDIGTATLVAREHTLAASRWAPGRRT